MASTTALAVRDLRKSYGPVRAVAGLDLEVRQGICVGLLGPNGAGKTTTVEICEGLLSPDSGDVELLGMRWERDRQKLRQRVGLVLQETQLSEKLTVRETLGLFRSFYRRARPLNELLDMVDLQEKARERVGGLSGGQRQRLALACAMVGSPDLLFLDEPTTGLDPQSRRGVWDFVAAFRASGGTVVLTTHYMDEAERLCDQIVVIDRGRVVARGSPRELIAGLGAGHVVEFTPESPARIRVEELLALDGVQEVRKCGDAFALQVSEIHRVVPALVAHVRERGSGVRSFSTHSPTLEDVFVSLTGRHLRDA